MYSQIPTEAVTSAFQLVSYVFTAAVALLNNTSENSSMEGLLLFVILAAIGYGLYRSGKRIGSIKGFHAGRRRLWRRRRW